MSLASPRLTEAGFGPNRSELSWSTTHCRGPGAAPLWQDPSEMVVDIIKSEFPSAGRIALM